MNTIPGHPLSLENFVSACYGEREYYTNENNQVTGYLTWFGGLYVCLTCGQLCDCYEYEN